MTTPAICGEAAERHLVAYVSEVGAAADPALAAKALEMLISKAALALAQVASVQASHEALLRTAHNTAAVMRRPGGPRPN